MSAVEQEANYFAMHLLVPTQMLRTELERLGGIDLVDDRTGALRKLAKNFQVSETIIAFRVAEEAGRK
jgi:Zn-dependent peptidase ImmA (M78 family)